MQKLGASGVNMTDPLNEPQTGSPKINGLGSRFRRVGQFIVQNPIRTAQLVFFLLVAIIILQNLEPTSIDVLFWPQLLVRAKARGCKTIDGLSMFVGQAMAQFKLFTGREGNADLMRSIVCDYL